MQLFAEGEGICNTRRSAVIGEEPPLNEDGAQVGK